MTTNILKEIEYDTGEFPKEILLKAIKQKDEVIPELLGILEYTCQNVESLVKQKNYVGHNYAIFLLAQFREKRAYPLLCSLLIKPYKLIDKLLDDMIFPRLPCILASVYNGNIEPLKSIIENEEINEFIRGSVLECIEVLIVQEIIMRDDILPYFLYLFHGGLKRKKESFVWDDLVLCCKDLFPEETKEEIKFAVDEKLIEQSTIELGDLVFGCCR